MKREEAIKVLRDSFYHHLCDEDEKKAVDMAISALQAEPSVSAERVGEWKPIEIKGYPYVTCDQCGMLADMVDYDGKYVMSMANANEKYANYCPNCGAKMK